MPATQPTLQAAARLAVGGAQLSGVLFVGGEGGVESVEDTQAFVYGTARGERTESRLGVMLGDRDGAQFLHQLVQAHGAVAGEDFHPCMRVVGKADGERRHGSALGEQRSRRDDRQPGEA